MRPVAEFLVDVRLIARRELGAVFDSGIATIYAVAFILLANSIFMNEFFLTGNVEMRGFFELMPLLLAFFLPAISMRVWAEERKQRTIEFLLTLPMRPAQAILGKYLACLAVFGLFVLGSVPIPVMLCVLGDPDLGLILSGYLGLLLFGALFLSFGTLLSALSGDQIVAFVTSTVVGFFLVLSGHPAVIAVVDGFFPELAIGSLLAGSVSVMPHYERFLAGVLELSALTYFVLLSALALFACDLVLRRVRA